MTWFSTHCTVTAYWQLLGNNSNWKHISFKKKLRCYSNQYVRNFYSLTSELASLLKLLSLLRYDSIWYLDLCYVPLSKQSLIIHVWKSRVNFSRCWQLLCILSRVLLSLDKLFCSWKLLFITFVIWHALLTFWHVNLDDIST